MRRAAAKPCAWKAPRPEELEPSLHPVAAGAKAGAGSAWVLGDHLHHQGSRRWVDRQADCLHAGTHWAFCRQR